MKLLALLTLAAVVALSADNPHVRFDELKAEARAAVASGDLAAAETKYRVLLDLAEEVPPPAHELYVEVVTPLAAILRQRADTELLEVLYTTRVDRATPGLAKGLAQADLGFFYQNSEVSVDRYHGERMVESAIRTFEACGGDSTDGIHCRRSLADTAGLQGAVFFQRRDYLRAEHLFRRVLAAPEIEVQREVLLVAIHALRGILILKKEFPEARTLAIRAAIIEARYPSALSRLRAPEGERSRKR